MDFPEFSAFKIYQVVFLVGQIFPVGYGTGFRSL
jgi:hypothetical protein